MTDIQPRSNPKSVISEALRLAQRAVQLDSDNDVAGALSAYADACALISKVLGNQEVRADRSKLTQIYETYNERIYLLQGLTPAEPASSDDFIPTPSSYRPLTTIPKSPGQHASAIESIAARRNTRNLKIRANGISEEAPRSATLPRPNLNHRTLTEPSPFITTRIPSTPLFKSISEENTNPRAIDGTIRRPSLNIQDLSRVRHQISRPQDRFMRSRSSASITPTLTSFSLGDRTFKTIDEENLKAPDEALMRPYWLMDLLKSTFALIEPSESGIYLTSSLYIPHEIWHGGTTKLKGEEEKIKAAELLIEALEGLLRIPEQETLRVFQQLLRFQDCMEESQLILSKKLGVEVVTSPTIVPHSTRQRINGRSISKLLGQRKQVDERPSTCLGHHGHYQATFHHLFSLAQQLTGLYDALEHDDLTIKEQVQLDQIFVHAAFFFGRVMVKLYLQDLGVLVSAKISGIT